MTPETHCQLHVVYLRGCLYKIGVLIKIALNYTHWAYPSRYFMQNMFYSTTLQTVQIAQFLKVGIDKFRLNLEILHLVTFTNHHPVVACGASKTP